MEGIDWDMIKALASVMSAIVAVMGGLILAATKSIFITKKEFFKVHDEVINGLYVNGFPIFVAQIKYNSDIKDLWMEIKEIKAITVPRKEWEESKALCAQQINNNQLIIRDSMNNVTLSIDTMRKELNLTNKMLDNYIGSFNMYIKLMDKDKGKT